MSSPVQLIDDCQLKADPPKDYSEDKDSFCSYIRSKGDDEPGKCPFQKRKTWKDTPIDFLEQQVDNLESDSEDLSNEIPYDNKQVEDFSNKSLLSFKIHKPRKFIQKHLERQKMKYDSNQSTNPTAGHFKEETAVGAGGEGEVQEPNASGLKRAPSAGMKPIWSTLGLQNYGVTFLDWVNITNSPMTVIAKVLLIPM